MVSRHFLLVFAWALFLDGGGWAAPSPGQPALPATQVKPLPAGAVARLGTLDQRCYNIGDVCFSPDGKVVRTISDRGSLWCEWDASTGTLRKVRPVKGLDNRHCDFLPDLSAYCLIAEDRVYLVDTLTGKTLAKTKNDSPGALAVRAIAPNGQRVAYNTRQGIAVWDLPTQTTFLLPIEEDKIIPGRLSSSWLVHDVEFSPNGQRIVFVTQDWIGNAGEVTCWDIAARHCLWTTRDKGAFHATTRFSPDGQTLVVNLSSPKGGGNLLQGWDATTGKPLPAWRSPPPQWFRILRGVSSDARLLLYDDYLEGYCLHIWDAHNGKERYKLPHDAYQVAFAPDGKSFVTVRGLLCRWDLASGRVLYRDPSKLGHDSPPELLGFSPDGKRLVSLANSSLLFWDLDRCLAHWIQKGQMSGPALFSPDNKVLFLGFYYSWGSASVWGLDVESGQDKVGLSVDNLFSDFDVRWYDFHLLPGGRIAALARLGVEDDSFYKATGLVTWDIKTGKVLTSLTLPEDMGPDTGLAPDGCTVVGPTKILNTQTKASRPLRLAAGELVEVGRISQDGRLVIGIIYHHQQNQFPSRKGLGVWEMATGKLVGRLPVTDQRRYLLTSDGKSVVVLSEARLAIWDLARRKEVWFRSAPELDGAFHDLAVSPDYRRAATSHALGTILLWDLPRPAGLAAPGGTGSPP